MKAQMRKHNWLVNQFRMDGFDDDTNYDDIYDETTNLVADAAIKRLLDALPPKMDAGCASRCATSLSSLNVCDAVMGALITFLGCLKSLLTDCVCAQSDMHRKKPF